MILELKAIPKTVEGKLIKLILPDFILLFLIIAAIGNAIIILSEIVQFPQVLLLVPAVLILAVIFSFLRFYKFLSNILRAMGALAFVYEELGGGTSEININFPKLLLIFGSLGGKQFSSSPAKDFTFNMISDSAKYKAETHITIQKGYIFDIKIQDWRGQTHTASARGTTPQLQNSIATAVSDIRRAVLESTGVQVQAIVPEAQVYRPEPKPVAQMVSKPTINEFKSKPTLVAPALPPILEKKAVEQKEMELKQQLETTKTKSEKESLQDVLFQLEEINKIIKED